ncbi:hypothetical protein GCM10027277_03580 [Pseudoduganella ginsengisoli]|uniref:Uncharacterized protein n=1 Tax=Pseudoduganella ginsengisoli TaxID=1462440 RepID=A0A6L6Q5W8_9BURK|nr:hypothetical protein [Pseudoduganella ginsengisoli]MTW04794.1 hypothetical protein [Pseudoduganella ginsengisoli]
MAKATVCKRIGKGVLGLVLCWAAYESVAAVPGPFFPHTYERGAFIVHSDEAIPASAAHVIDDAQRRIERSPLHGAHDKYDIYICNSLARFAFYNHKFTTRAGGVTEGAFTRHVFIRGVDFDTNSLRMPGGARIVDAESRSASYFLAHEAAHVMESRRFGRLAYVKYPHWLMEGYADVVGKNDAFHIADYRQPFASGTLANDGTYKREHLLVDFQLGLGKTVMQVFAEALPQHTVEAQLAAALTQNEIGAIK